MNSDHEKIQKLEQKIAFLEECHREQARYLSWRICELEHEMKQQLSSILPDLKALEKIVFDAHISSNEKAQDALAEVDEILPLDDIPEAFFSRIPTIREARRKS